MKKILLILCIFCFSKIAFSQYVFTDKVFDDNIRTVQSQNVISLGREFNITFDYIGGDAPYMLAKIIHCNWDWTQSILVDNEFLNGFNEIQLNDLEPSSSSKIPYYHYSLELPSVKLSGNYIVKIYDEDNPKVTYLTQRFSVYENAVVVSGNKSLSNVVNNRFNSQQLDFTIQYGQYEIQDPYESLHVVIRQNGRWDNAKTNLKPSFIGLGQNQLKYSFFNGESSFPGLREYRQFDFIDTRRNVDFREIYNEGDKIFLREDFNSSVLNYVDDMDENGKFSIRDPFDADYSYVYFRLKTAKIDEEVYVFGELSDWQLKERFKMNYDSLNQRYEASILLKQGEYNYSYAVKSNNKADEVFFQGSHSETRNDYDVLIYHRPFGKYYDLLIAYRKLD